MIKAIAKNKLNVEIGSAIFPDLVQATAWIDSNKNTGVWGSNEVTLSEQDAINAGKVISEAIETIVDTDIDGNQITYYKFAAEFTIEFVDVTQQIAKQNLIEYGRKAQDFGKGIIAEVLAINELKLEAGLMTEQQLLLLLQSEGLKEIERLLYNGSLKTSKGLIAQLDNTFFSAEEKAAIIAEIDAFLISENKL